MTKIEFMRQLEQKLSDLPKKDAIEHLSFYSEMIDDRMEDGLSEDEAVRAAGNADEIAAQIMANYDGPIKQRKQFKAWVIVLIVLGSPIWLSLLVVAFSVLVSLFASAWAIAVSLWAVFASFVGCAFGGVISGSVLALFVNKLSGVATLGAGILFAGLSIYTFFLAEALTKGLALLTKKTALWIVKLFSGREAA